MRTTSAVINRAEGERDSYINEVRGSSLTAPGQYEVQEGFGKKDKGFTMSSRIERKVEETTAGPGEYELDRANSATRTRTTTFQFSNAEARPANFATSTSEQVGPGHYEVQQQEVKSF